jgi:membrane protein DedA with SNARE-associated domain
MYFLLALSIHGVSTWITALVTAWVNSYGYAAVFVLMLMESATLPVPSEVVLPLAGLLASKGILNFYLALGAATLGSMIGSVIDYAIGYYLGKEVVYKHLQLFHVKKQDLDNFDVWFTKNGLAAVFLTRFIPILRTVINFPAGFAKMPLKKFLSYTFAGVLIWDIALMLVGYYILSAKSVSVLLAGVAVFAIVLYIVYRFAASKMRKKG